jgi:HEAT repeat protein
MRGERDRHNWARLLILWGCAALAAAGTAVASPGPETYRGRPLQAYLSAFDAVAPAERAAAARAVGQFAPEAVDAVPPLVVLLGDREMAVREAAAEALAGFGPAAAPAVPVLASLLHAPSPRLRGLAALALREIGPASAPALPALIDALKERDLIVRYQVGLTIAALGSAAKPAVPALMTAMDEDPDEWVSIARRDMRRAMALALGEIGPDAREALPLLRKWMAFYRVAWVAAPVIQKIEGEPEPPRYR